MSITLVGRVAGPPPHLKTTLRAHLVFEERIVLHDADEAELWKPAKATTLVASDGRFSFDLGEDGSVRGPGELQVVAADGTVLASRAVAIDGTDGPVEIRVEAPEPAEVDPHPDPLLGRDKRLVGKIRDQGGGQPPAGLQVILWARRDAEGDDWIAAVVARIDGRGYFSAPYPAGSFSAARGALSLRGSEIELAVPLNDDGTLPEKLLLVADIPDALPPDDTEVPRSADSGDLTASPQTYSVDLVGGRCVDFSVPNRSLEEFSFYTIVRTTEPEIKGLTLREPPRVPVRVVDAALALDAVLVDTSESDEPSGSRLAPAPRINRAGAASARALRATFTGSEAPTRASVDSAAAATRINDLRATLDAVVKPVPGRGELNAKNPVDWDADPTFYQAATIAHGHLLHFKQVWRADGYSLGDLLYSLPLAPCQKKQIAIVDWDRRDAARRSEALEAEDRLAGLVDRDRDIGEVVRTTVRESTRGGSEASVRSGGGGLGLAIGPLVLGAAGGASNANSTAWQDSSRTLGAQSLQQLRDRTMSAASSVRSQRSTVVQTVEQGESLRVQTEVVHNHNHCHAMTVQYFEVLRHFQVSQELSEVRECLFVPLMMSRFDGPKAVRWRDVLDAFLADPELRRGFDALERIATAYADSDVPTGSYAEDTLEHVDGELRLAFSISRPEDDDDGEFRPENWGGVAELTRRSPRYWFDRFVATAADRDRAFEQSVAPRVAEAFVQSLEFFLIGGAQQARIDLDATLVSSYAPDTPLYVSLRPRAPVPAWRRADVLQVLIGTTQNLPPFSKAMVRSATLRYRTAHFDGPLARDHRVVNDLTVGDQVLIPTPLRAAERVRPRADDRRAAASLLRHLNENLEHYHKVLWLTMEPSRRYMLLDGFEAPHSGGRSVASVVENRVIGIVGNSFVLPVAPGVKLDPTYAVGNERPVDLLHHYAPSTPVPPMRISVPTTGVFAEAVLGKCNSCEIKDETRFWRLEESPCGDEPTAIQPVSADSRASTPPNLTAAPLAAPIVNLQNAPAAPDPTGLAAALQVVGSPNLFRDITGLEGNQRNALSALQTTMETARSFGDQAAKLAQMKQLQEGSGKTLQTIKQAHRDKLLSDGQAKDLTNSYLRKMIGGGVGDPKLTDDPEIRKLIGRGATGADSEVSVRRGSESVDVKTGETPDTSNGDGGGGDEDESDEDLDFKLKLWTEPHGRSLSSSPEFDIDTDLNSALVFVEPEHFDLGHSAQSMIDHWAQNGLIMGGAMIDTGLAHSGSGFAAKIDSWKIHVPDGADAKQPYGTLPALSRAHWHWITPNNLDEGGHTRWTESTLRTALKDGDALALSIGQIAMLAGDYVGAFPDLKQADGRARVNIMDGFDAKEPFAYTLLDLLAFPSGSLSTLRRLRRVRNGYSKVASDIKKGAFGALEAVVAFLHKVAGRDPAQANVSTLGNRLKEFHVLAQLLWRDGDLTLDAVVEQAPWITTQDVSTLTRALPQKDVTRLKKTGFDAELFHMVVTNGQYAQLAATNSPHFAPQHTVAFGQLQNIALLEIEKHVTQPGSHAFKNPIPAEALAKSAFSLHYLSDAFSAGHMRVPRRHAGFKGALAAKLMHDIDGRYGLLVRNGFNQTWRAFGDKFLDPGSPPKEPEQAWIINELKNKPGISADPRMNRDNAVAAVCSALKQLHYEAQRHRTAAAAAPFKPVLDHNLGTSAGLAGDSKCPAGKPADGADRDAWLPVDVRGKATYMRKHFPVAVGTGSAVTDNAPPLYDAQGNILTNGTYKWRSSRFGNVRHLQLWWHGKTRKGLTGTKATQAAEEEFTEIWHLADVGRSVPGGTWIDKWMGGGETWLIDLPTKVPKV